MIDNYSSSVAEFCASKTTSTDSQIIYKDSTSFIDCLFCKSFFTIPLVHRSGTDAADRMLIEGRGSFKSIYIYIDIYRLCNSFLWWMAYPDFYVVSFYDTLTDAL